MLPFKSTNIPKTEKYVIDDGIGNVLEVEKQGYFTVGDMIAWANAHAASLRNPDSAFAKEAVNRVLAHRLGLDQEKDHLVNDKGQELPYSFIEAAYLFLANERNCWKEIEPIEESEGKDLSPSTGKKSTGS